MRHIVTKNLAGFLTLALAISVSAFLLSCKSSDSPTNSGGGGGGGGGREFVSPDLSGSGGSFTHVFDSAKVIPYYCKYHGGPGGSGMSGVITVNAGGTPSSHSYSIVVSTLPSFAIDEGDTVTWTNNSGLLHTVESDN